VYIFLDERVKDKTFLDYLLLNNMKTREIPAYCDTIRDFISKHIDLTIAKELDCLQGFETNFIQMGIDKELDEQFLLDGAHFELSPMYHTLAMEDLLDLLSISNYLPLSFPKEKIKIKLLKGMEWLKTMIYNNEELSHFNDQKNYKNFE
jgi:hypothetical protein